MKQVRDPRRFLTSYRENEGTITRWIYCVYSLESGHIIIESPLIGMVLLRTEARQAVPANGIQ